MEKKALELVQALLPNDEELRQHYEDHLEFEKQLGELNRKLYLTPEQDLQRREIQKRKLAGKDRIMEILQRHRETAASH